MKEQRTLHAPRNSPQCLTLGESGNAEQKAPPLASLWSANTKEKCSLLSCFARGGDFLKLKGHFFFGVLPSKYSGSEAGQRLKWQEMSRWGNGLGFAQQFYRKV